MNRLKIKELTFSAAHYIPDHPKCSALHGHTFFIRDLIIDCEEFVDFAVVKKIIDQWDHTLIVPERDYKSWLELVGDLKDGTPWRLDLMTVKGDPTCEDLAIAIRRQIHAIPGVTYVEFELYEGSNQGVMTHSE